MSSKNSASRKEANRRVSEVSSLIQSHQIKMDSREQPIEYRNLYQYARSMAQGSLEIILDVLTPSESNLQRPINIKPPEPLFYEIR
jgi:hypothetical protein